MIKILSVINYEQSLAHAKNIFNVDINVHVGCYWNNYA